MPNVYVLTDENGNEIGRREYDAFGRVISQTGDWSQSRFGFNPNWMELEDSGGRFVVSPTRIYDKETGRYLSRDPLASAAPVAASTSGNALGNWKNTVFGDVVAASPAPGQDPPHPYAYVANNPLSGADATGLQEQEAAEPPTPVNQEAKLTPIVEAAAKKNGVPPAILKALVKQESQWDPSAKSPTGPIGLMQFTKSTAREQGLRVDDKVDERLDPAKAAEAGAKYLKFQYSKFPEAKEGLERWRFALGAYNRGRGKINQTIRDVGFRGKKCIEWKDVAPQLTGRDQEGKDYVRKIVGEEGEISGYAKQYGAAAR